MLLTISTTHRPATDLGFLLHKNPARAHSRELSFGRAHVVYPEATDERCTAALVLEVDPIALVRRTGAPEGLLTQYVNDRPYAASSFMSVAIARVFGSALGGRSTERPDLVDTPIPLQAHLAALPCSGGQQMLRGLFEPLGYAVEARAHVLDERFPEWGESEYVAVTLSATTTLKELLEHLYVLIPVLDAQKHYWITADEVDKLMRRGGAWLGAHPMREVIVKRYLKYQRSLADEALARLVQEEQPDAAGADDEARANDEVAMEAPLGLGAQRIDAVLDELHRCGAARVIDLGCGEGRLLAALLKDGRFTQVVGMDTSHRALQRAAERLGLERMAPMQRARITLVNGSLLYRDARLSGFDAATLLEVVEHLDPGRLPTLERVVFEFAQPQTVVVTTPNVEYNTRFAGLPPGALRHPDHRFEWTRALFESWARGVAERRGYRVSFRAVGPVDPDVGAPTQMGIFTR